MQKIVAIMLHFKRNQILSFVEMKENFLHLDTGTTIWRVKKTEVVR